MVKKTFSQVFATICGTLEIHNMDEPFRINKSDNKKYKEYSLDNPNSKATYLVLILFSMDFPVSLYLNNAIHRND